MTDPERGAHLGQDRILILPHDPRWPRMFEEERARIEAAVPSRRYFRKFGPHGERTHQIHLVERTDRGWWDRHLAFRDYLRAQSETAREYGRLKLDLAARFRDDCAGYMDAKAELVGSIERRALDARSSG